MSRSYRKPYVVDQSNKRFGKRCANKKVRKAKIVPKRKGYKKIYCSYDISDYCWYYDTPETRRK